MHYANTQQPISSYFLPFSVKKHQKAVHYLAICPFYLIFAYYNVTP